MSEKAQRAKALFLEGYNCAQAVAGAFAPEMGLSVDAAARLASGFGGGMGRMREVCGAVSGMTLAASALRGYNDPKAGPEKTDTYAMIQELAGRFRAENGSIICRELLGLARPEGTPQAEARTPEYYKKRPCPELVALADKHRVTLLAVTDHDTFDGAAQLLGKPAPMPILQGVELSLRDMPGLHLLGYGRGTDTPLHRKVRALSQMRLGRARQMVEKLNALGYSLDYDEIAREAKGSVGRPHIARAMVSRGYVADTREAFDRFLADGAPAYVAGERLSMAEALPLMRESGFVPVLAHPMELEKTGALLRHLLGVWQEQGLRGVEVYHPSAGRATPLLDLTARRMGFLVTGGSDFHGDGDRHGMVGCTAPMWARAADDVEKLLQAVEAAEIM